jgi:hypothetical protein
MGEVGLSGLLERAIGRTEAEHPAAKHLRMSDGGRPRDAVMEAVEAHGIAAVQGAVTALTAALVEILARLIGEDMAIRIIDPGHAGLNTDDTPAAS